MAYQSLIFSDYFMVILRRYMEGTRLSSEHIV